MLAGSERQNEGTEMTLFLSAKIKKDGAWGQSFKTFYTLGQIYKSTLKHVNNAMRPTFVWRNVRTLPPNIFVGLHFSFSLNRQFRHFI